MLYLKDYYFKITGWYSTRDTALSWCCNQGKYGETC